MNTKLSYTLLIAIFLALSQGCSGRGGNPDVKEGVRKALTQAGFSDIKVSQDRVKGIVTLRGDVQTEIAKLRAEQAANLASGSLVIANQIGVRPGNYEESAAIKSDPSLDDGIKKNFEALLVSRKLADGIKCDARNGVLTLTGKVHRFDQRKELEKMAASVPHVQQVENQLQMAEAQTSNSF